MRTTCIYIWRTGGLNGYGTGIPISEQSSRRLAKQFRLNSRELEILRRGDEIVLRERPGAMVRAFDLLASVPDDLEIAQRNKARPQKRI